MRQATSWPIRLYDLAGVLLQVARRACFTALDLKLDASSSSFTWPSNSTRFFTIYDLQVLCSSSSTSSTGAGPCRSINVAESKNQKGGDNICFPERSFQLMFQKRWRFWIAEGKL